MYIHNGKGDAFQPEGKMKSPATIPDSVRTASSRTNQSSTASLSCAAGSLSARILFPKRGWTAGAAGVRGRTAGTAGVRGRRAGAAGASVALVAGRTSG